MNPAQKQAVLLELRRKFEAMSNEELVRISPRRADQPEPTDIQKTAGFIPTPRQRDFLALNCEEALYGGAAGGGKSEALLAWLAEGVATPGYAGLIFRRTYPQLAKADGLIPKSFKMYKPLGGQWQATEKRWTFPSGATIELGHLHLETSIYDYQGPSYHRIAFDELTQFSEGQYLYLFSRLRRTEGFPIRPAMRAGSNPGGEGHTWVKKRFITKEAMAFLAHLDGDSPSPVGLLFWADVGRAFVPARLADNPYLDRADYEGKLAHLDPVTRARLKAGDWSVTEDSAVKLHWLRYWDRQGTFTRLLHPSGSNRLIEQQEFWRIVTVDPAGSTKDLIKERKGKPLSYSTIAVCDWHRGLSVMPIRHIRRGRWDITQLCSNIREVHAAWRPLRTGIEATSNGPAALTLCKDLSGIYALDHKGQDKLTRASRMLTDFSEGRIYIELDGIWREDLESELLAWMGGDDEQADQIDTLAYACNHVPRVEQGRTVRIDRGLMVKGV